MSLTQAFPWVPPSICEEYRLVRLLGRGAMGEVYLAHDTLLDRPVALKFIASVAPDVAQRERFRTEARAIARVQHPNVVDIYRVGEVQQHPYLVSEFLRGESLDRLAKPLPWPRVLGLAIGLARGLAAAHRCGVLHRDIKPANAMLTEEGEVKLLDFGVAKLLDVTIGVAGRRQSALHAEVHEGGQAPGDDTLVLLATGSTEPPGGGGSPRASPTGLVGTPLYMAPEVWRGEPASARSDLYSLGVLLYELCSGTTPYMAQSRQELREAVERQPIVPLAQVAPDVDPALASIITRCLAREPTERFSSADALREALEALQESAQEEAGPRERPYPGLHPFTAKDRATFFGRASQVRALLDRLRAEPLVLVTGDSGAGKSSLCRAGVLPRVSEGALGTARAWAVCEVLPGREPLLALAVALAPHLGCREKELLDDLAQAPREVERRARAYDSARGVLVFVDQLEELVTQAKPEDAERFSLALDALARGGPWLRVLAAVRSDFLARLAALPGLGEHLSRGLYLLPDLDEAGLREAIAAPARAQGFTFESEALVNTLVAAGKAEGALPLLQFALAELWERRDREQRTVPAEALLALGGVEGALARHADGVLAGLRPGQRLAARRVLLRMVQAEGTRARRTRAELLGEGEAEDAEARAALEALVRGRLILAREASGEEGLATYELAHEALLKGWDTLRGWLASGEEQRALRQRLERACAEWHRLGRTSEHLWGRRQLEEATRLDKEALSALEVLFLRTSEQTVRRQRGLRWLAAFLLLPALGGPYGALRLQTYWEAQQARRETERVVNALVEEARAAFTTGRYFGQQAVADRASALALFDGRNPFDDVEEAKMPQERWLRAESDWARALNELESADASFTKAEQTLDDAISRGYGQSQSDRLLKEIHYERLLLAGIFHHTDEREKLLLRFERVATKNSLWEDFRRKPAELEIVTEPPGASIEFKVPRQGVVGGISGIIGSSGQISSMLARRPDLTPISSLFLSEGSYHLRFTKEGYVPVDLPVLLEGGKSERIFLKLPSSVPEGYVYIPPGCFLSGSADPETVREFLVSPPLHRRCLSEGYLIGKTEVTLGDWLAYLDTLPEGAPERHMLDQQRSGFSTAYRLIRLPDHSWGFALQLETGELLTARAGEPLRYPGRKHHSEQNWLRFPLAGVSAEDVTGYLAWLDESGRLPGARLCTEHEWTRAARGADDRPYPHGNKLQEGEANIDVTYGRQPDSYGPDEVGTYRDSVSPFGLYDMAGNVYEMTRAMMPGLGDIAARGGGWYYDRVNALIPHRQVVTSKNRNATLGLRVCASFTVH